MFRIHGKLVVLEDYQVDIQPQSSGKGDGAYQAHPRLTSGTVCGKKRVKGEVPFEMLGCSASQGHVGSGSGTIGPSQQAGRETGNCYMLHGDTGKCSGKLVHPDPKVQPQIVDCQCEFTMRQPGGAAGGQVGEKAAEGPSELQRQDSSHISLRVLDESDQPVPGVVLCLQSANGLRRSGRTGKDGALYFEGVGPGPFSVISPLQAADLECPHLLDPLRGMGANESKEVCLPGKQDGTWCLANVQQYKVAKRDSLQSLADLCNRPLKAPDQESAPRCVTWRDLATFNWGTADPEAVNACLRDEVGCRRRDKSGRNFRFDDADCPGLVLLPIAWRRDRLATGGPHVVKVQRAKLDDDAAGSLRRHFRVYRVKRGDTLWGIAERELHDPYRWPQIARDNRISEHPRTPGLYPIYLNEPLLLRKRTGAPTDRALSPATGDVQPRAEVKSPGPTAQSGASPAPSGAPPSHPAAGPSSSGTSLLERGRNAISRIAHAAVTVSFPVGLKTKVYEDTVAEGVGLGYHYVVKISGEIRLQRHGDVEWWTNPEHDMIEYKKELKLWAGKHTLSLFNGMKIEGISSERPGPPNVRVTILGFKTDTTAQYISAIAPNVWIYTYKTEFKFAMDGVDYFGALVHETTVTFMPVEQLKQVVNRVLLDLQQLDALVEVSWALVMAGAIALGLHTLAEVIKYLALAPATRLLPLVIPVPELQKYANPDNRDNYRI